MGQVLHGSSTKTEAIRRAIQRSQASLRTLAKRHGINPKTVAKWRKRSFVADLPTGSETAELNRAVEEAIVVAFRRHTLLPLDDCLCHTKAEHRMGRNYLKGRDGDRINAILAAAGYNFSILLHCCAPCCRRS